MGRMNLAQSQPISRDPYDSFDLPNDLASCDAPRSCKKNRHPRFFPFKSSRSTTTGTVVFSKRMNCVREFAEFFINCFLDY